MLDMELRSFNSRWKDDITDFINANRIIQAHIQCIVYDSERKCFTLFYWGKD